MTLKPLVGRDRLMRLIGGAFARSTLPQVLLLRGSRGTGKQRLSLWIAQLLLCDSPAQGAPCDECLGCRSLLRLEHPDLLWYFPTENHDKRGVSREREEMLLEDIRLAVLAQIREDPLRPITSEGPLGIRDGTVRQLKREARRRPGIAARRVFVVGEAQELVAQESSQSAANALLKLFEEPSADHWFLLTSSEPGRILPTIRSRATEIFVPPVAESEVFTFLRAHAQATEQEIRRVTRLSEGSVGRALGFLSTDDEPGPLEKCRQEAFFLLQSALDPSPAARFTQALMRPSKGARQLHPTLVALESWLRDLAALAASEDTPVLNGDGRARDWLLNRLSGRPPMAPSRIAECRRYVEEARHLASGNLNPQLIMCRLLADLHRGLRAATLPTPKEDP